MNRLMAVSEPRVRQLLTILDSKEQEILSAQCFLAVEKLGDITLRGSKPGETVTDLLEKEYVRWAQRLADIFGVPTYPFSARFKNRGPGSIPVLR